MHHDERNPYSVTNRDLSRHVDVKVHCVVCHREIETGLVSLSVHFLFSPLPVRWWPVEFLFLLRKTVQYVKKWSKRLIKAQTKEKWIPHLL